MDLSDCVLKIGNASFRWEDESPMRKRNRLAQREYRKRKRYSVRHGAKDLDSATESPSPTRPILESVVTGPDLSSTVQPSGPVNNLQLSAPRKIQALLDRHQLTPISFSTHSDQASPVESLNTGQFCDDTMSIGSAYPYDRAPSCLPVAGSPGILQGQPPFEGRLEAGHLDVMTTGYFWSDEQSLPTPATEECADPQATVSFPGGVMSPPTSHPSRLSTCSPTGFVGPRNDLTRGRDGGIGHSTIDHLATTPANLEDRFETILDACKAAGYHSIDSMATEYYTASFSPNSSLAATQSRSRSRDLPELLDNLYAASSAYDHERQNSWAFNESEKFREKILRLATNILIDEVGQMDRVQDEAAGLGPPALRRTTAK